MTVIMKVTWIVASIFNSISLLYFLIGSTAFFNRPTGTSWGYYFMFVGFPISILIVTSIVCFVFGWMPRSNAAKMGLIVLTVLITFITIFTAPLPIDKEGWLTERVWTQAFVQTTQDGKFDYSLEIVNAFQKKSNARLFIRDVASGEETRIPLRMKDEKISIRGGGAGEEFAWSHLISVEAPQSIYVLTTTEYLKKEIEIFEIDMETKTSRRLE